MSVISKSKLLTKLRNKEYRDAYVEEKVATSLPFQIRALREQPGRNWSQSELGQRAGMRQNAISRLEDAESGTPSISTLLRLARAFDVALLVKFVPFSKLLSEFADLSSEALSAPSFNEEIELLESQSTADLSDFEIVSSGIVQLPARRTLLAGLSSSTVAYVGIGSDVFWKHWNDVLEEVYYITPQPDFTVPDDWFPGSAHLVKGSTTADLVM